MKYRAILILPPGVERERPVQCFGESIDALRLWAKKILALSENNAPGFRVEIYESHESLLEVHQV